MSAIDPRWILLPRLIEDPFPVYRELRRHDPVHRNAVTGTWYVSRYRDVAQLLRDPRLSVGAMFGQLAQTPPRWIERTRAVRRALLSWSRFLDPPRHARLRELLARALMPRLLKELEPAIQEWTYRLLDAAERKSGGTRRLELMADLAGPLPGMAISHLIGGDAEDGGRCQEWGHDLGLFIGKLLLNDEEADRAEASTRKMNAYVNRLLAARRKEPRQDLVSMLIAARAAGDLSNSAEVRGLANLLFAAGSDNSTNLIGNGLLALLLHRESRERLVADPSLAAPAVEEFMRYDTPSQLTGRVAIEDIELGGSVIRAGDFVSLMIGSANRDEEHFVDPDRLDLLRADNQHVGFGQGIHFCVGAHLSRTTARIAISSVLRRYPSLRLAEGAPPTRHLGVAYRGLRELPVAF